MQDKLLTAEQLKDAIDSFFLDFYSFYLKQYDRELVVKGDLLHSLPAGASDCLYLARQTARSAISSREKTVVELSDRMNGLRFFLAISCKENAFIVRFGVRDNPLNKSIEKIVKSSIKMLGKTYFISYDNPGII